MVTDIQSRFPDFLIGGTAKSGTSSLYYYLNQHPAIYMLTPRASNFYGLGEQPPIHYGGPVPSKRPKKASLKEFMTTYANVPSGKIIGEGSSFFNFTTRAAQRMHHYKPDSKILFVLRHPVDRAFSQFVYARKCGWEPCSSFEKAFHEESLRKKEGWFPFLLYKESSLYAEKLRLFYQLFGTEQIHVCTFDHFKDNTGKAMGDIFGFLGVDTSPTPNVAINHNPSSLQPLPWIRSPFNTTSSRIISKIPKIVQTPLFYVIDKLGTHKPTLNAKLRYELAKYYQHDIQLTQSIIGINLSPWLL